MPLLLCWAVLVLWAGSYWGKDAVEFQFGNARWELASELGTFRLSNDPQLKLEQALVQRDSRPGRRAAIKAVQPPPMSPPTSYGVPHWIVAAAVAIPPAARGAKILRRRRARRLLAARGLCPACGYDLRATPVRCPECGAGIVASRAERVVTPARTDKRG